MFLSKLAMFTTGIVLARVCDLEHEECINYEVLYVRAAVRKAKNNDSRSLLLTGC